METKENVLKKVKDVIEAPSCCPELKNAAQKYLDSVGKPEEKENAAQLIVRLNEDVLPIDAIISFMKTDIAVKKLGEETAKNYAKHAEDVKAAGGKYCDCPACSAGLYVLENKDAIL